MCASRFAKRAGVVFAMLMIGDGFLAMVQPERHLRLWKGWSDLADDWIDALAERPGLTRLSGAAAMAAGLALAHRQWAERPFLESSAAEGWTPQTFVIEREETVVEVGQ